MQAKISDARAIEILTQFCNPKSYPTEEEVIAALEQHVPREILASLRGYLGDVIDNDAMTGPEKVKKYFNLSISNDEKAETFIDEIYCAISEHLFADEEE